MLVIVLNTFTRFSMCEDFYHSLDKINKTRLMNRLGNGMVSGILIVFGVPAFGVVTWIFVMNLIAGKFEFSRKTVDLSKIIKGDQNTPLPDPLANVNPKSDEYTVFAGNYTTKRKSNNMTKVNRVDRESVKSIIQEIIQKHFTPMVIVKDSTSENESENFVSLDDNDIYLKLTYTSISSKKVMEEISQKISNYKSYQALINKTIFNTVEQNSFIIDVPASDSNEISHRVRSAIASAEESYSLVQQGFSHLGIKLFPVESIDKLVEFDEALKNVKTLKQDYLNKLTNPEYADDEVMRLFDEKAEAFETEFNNKLESLIVEGAELSLKKDIEHNDSVTLETLNKLMKL